MSSTPLSKRLLAVFLCLSVFVLLPFVYSLHLQDMEQSPRFLVLAFIVSVAIIISLVTVIAGKTVYTVNATGFVLLLFLLFYYSGLMKSISFWDAFFECLKLTLFVVLYFLFTTTLQADKFNRLLYIKGVAIAATVFLFFGGYQILETASTKQKGLLDIINYSITSTLGNKNFLAEVLLMMLPLAAAGYIFHSRVWKIFFAITAVMILVMLAVLQTLSTWVALVAMGFLIIILVFRFSSRLFSSVRVKRWFLISIAGTGLLVVFAMLMVLRGDEKGSIRRKITAFQKELKSEAAPADSSRQNSISERLYLWKTSIKLVKDHKVLGAGTGNWKLELPAYGLGSSQYMTTGAIRFVHPHNDFFLYASELGLIGLLVFLAFLYLLYRGAWRMLKSAPDQNEFWYAAMLLAALTVYIVVAMVSLPSNRIFPMILLMLFAAQITAGNSGTFATIRKPVAILMLFVFLMGSLTAVYIGKIRLQGDFSLSAALRHDRKRNYDAMRRILDKTNTTLFPLDATATPLAWYQGYAAFYTGDREKAFAFFRKAEKENPNHLNVLNDLGTSYNLAGDPVTAVKYYQKVLTIQPAYGDALMNMAVIYYNQGRVEDAFNSLILFNRQMKPETLKIFQTILMARASMLTTDEKKLKTFSDRLKNPGMVKKVLDEIKANQGRLEASLK